VTAMALREGWRRWELGLQKPKELGGEENRENMMNFFLGSTHVFLRFFF
jgi:hypothetical protein